MSAGGSSTAASVARMGNQIARHFAHLGDEAAVLATADHIAQFWDPRMRAIAQDLRGQDAFGAIAEAALRKLAEGEEPPPQTRATRFNAAGEAGHSDAG